MFKAATYNENTLRAGDLVRGEFDDDDRDISVYEFESREEARAWAWARLAETPATAKTAHFRRCVQSILDATD